MNERILKLARKSGATVNEGYDGTKSFVYGITMSPEELEKFAELMVVEFTETVKQTANELAESGFRQGQSEEEVMKSVNGALAVLKVMRERFEVGMTTEDKKTLIKELLGVKND